MTFRTIRFHPRPLLLDRCAVSCTNQRVPNTKKTILFHNTAEMSHFVDSIMTTCLGDVGIDRIFVDEEIVTVLPPKKRKHPSSLY